MLTDEEKHEIDEELERYPTKQAVCVEAMKIVQRRRGWVSEEDLRDIGEYLSLTVADLDTVATFYNLVFRQPVGRHVILMCDSISCYVMRFEGLREHLRQRLGVDFGGTTADGRFTFLPVVCLGACDHAPTMMIDNDLHQDLTPEKLDAILEQYQ